MEGIAFFLVFVIILGGIGLVIGTVDMIIDIYNQATNEEIVIIETKEVKVTHLDIKIISPTEKRYYASVYAEDISVVVEISEHQYIGLCIGDIVVLQIETTENTKLDDVVKYTIIKEVTK